MIGRLVVLYNKINMKEFCSCCIFNQYLIFQVQIISRASRCKHASCHSWTLYQTCHFLVCWPVTVPHNISSALMIIRNVFLAWYAIECMFILVCWSIWELSCPQFLILAFIWLLLQLLWLWRPRLLMIFCPRVIRWFRKRKRQNNMLHCHLVSLFDLWGWFIEATLQNTRNLCIISCKFGPVVLVGEWYKLFIFWMVRERESRRERGSLGDKLWDLPFGVGNVWSIKFDWVRWKSRSLIPDVWVLDTYVYLMLQFLVALWKNYRTSVHNFFICYLAALWPTLGHCWWGSLTNLIFIFAFTCFDLKVTRSLVTRLGPKSWSST